MDKIILTNILSQFISSKNTILFLIISISVSFISGYYYGYNHERNRAENKQKQDIILNQESVIRKMTQIAIFNNKVVTNLQESNAKLTQRYIKTQEELTNAKKNINRLNVIRGDFLRYISTAGSNSMSTSPFATPGAYDPTTAYRPTDVGDRINALVYECNIIRNNLIALQEWNLNLAKN